MQRFYKSKEFLKYSVVGTTGFLVNMGIFIVLTRLFHIKIEYASPIAIESAILSNFILNNVWTFNLRAVKTSIIKRFVRFHIVALAAGIVNYSILLFLVYSVGVLDIISNIIGIISALMVNYMLNSYWTWKTDKES